MRKCNNTTQIILPSFIILNAVYFFVTQCCVCILVREGLALSTASTLCQASKATSHLMLNLIFITSLWWLQRSIANFNFFLRLQSEKGVWGIHLQVGILTRWSHCNVKRTIDPQARYTSNMILLKQYSHFQTRKKRKITQTKM